MLPFILLFLFYPGWLFPSFEGKLELGHVLGGLYLLAQINVSPLPPAPSLSSLPLSFPLPVIPTTILNTSLPLHLPSPLSFRPWWFLCQAVRTIFHWIRLARLALHAELHEGI